MGRRNANALKVRTRPRHTQALSKSETVYLRYLSYGEVQTHGNLYIVLDNGDGTVELDIIPSYRPERWRHSAHRSVPLSNIFYGTPGD